MKVIGTDGTHACADCKTPCVYDTFCSQASPAGEFTRQLHPCKCAFLYDRPTMRPVAGSMSIS